MTAGTAAGRTPSTGKPPFERVVSEHGARVLRVCGAVVGATDADDAWSETFLAAMRAYPDLPADARIEGWLVTIAHRKAIDIIRSRARREIPLAELPDRPTDVEEGAVLRCDDLVAAVGRLPHKQRMAVAYHHLGGLPYAEVAAIIGGSTSAARRAAADGMATLRRTYTATPDEGADR